MTNFNGKACICGCRQRVAQLHHVVYRQELRHHAERRHDGTSYKALCADERNLVPVALDCHNAHHGRSRPFSLHVLPDSVYEFAAEILGVGAGYEYLKRRYVDFDMRLERMLGEPWPVPLDPIGHMQARQARR